MPELPDAKRERLVAEYGIRMADAELLTQDQQVAEYFESTCRATTTVAPQTVANWMLVELFRLLSESGTEITSCQVSPEALAELLELLEKATINGTTAKEVLSEMFSTGRGAEEIVNRRGLAQINDEEALRTVVLAVLEQNPRPVQQYLEGKSQVLGFLVGQVMRQTRGQQTSLSRPRCSRQSWRRARPDGPWPLLRG